MYVLIQFLMILFFTQGENHATSSVPDIDFGFRINEKENLSDGWKITGHAYIDEYVSYSEYVDGYIHVIIRAYQDTSPEEFSSILEDMNLQSFNRDTTVFGNLVEVRNQPMDTIYELTDVPVISYRKGFGESVVYQYPEIITLLHYRGYSYYIEIMLPDTASVQLADKARKECNRLNERIFKTILKSNQVFFSWIGYGNQDSIKRFMHLRPFWIHPSDTMSRYPVFDACYDGIQYEYLSYSPAFALWKGSGDASGKQGMVQYLSNTNDYSSSNLLGQNVFIYWSLVDVPESGNTSSSFSSNSAILTPRLPDSYRIWYDDFWWGQDRFSIDSTYTSESAILHNFKGVSTYVTLSKLLIYEYLENGTERRERYCYRTDIFFSKDGIQYQIINLSPNEPSFHKKTDETWQWFERHWYWTDEPHPDWTEYPINWEQMRLP